MINTASEIIDRVFKGRHSLRDLTGLDPAGENVEIVMSVHTHMILMTELHRRIDESPMLHSVAQKDPEAPAGVRIYGMPVRREPTFDVDEIRFRSEVRL